MSRISKNTLSIGKPGIVPDIIVGVPLCQSKNTVCEDIKKRPAMYSLLPDLKELTLRKSTIAENSTYQESPVLQQWDSFNEVNTSSILPMYHVPKTCPIPKPSSAGRLNKFTKQFIIPAVQWVYSPLIYEKEIRIEDEYKIGFSVFDPFKTYITISNEAEFNRYAESKLENGELNAPDVLDSAGFQIMIDTVKDEIQRFPPTRIREGSSGSYFVYTDNQTVVGVFKPKDEEPYGPLSPKWTKWLHRTLFPCFFGRSCLIPNLGYVSEAAASVLDKQLLSFIVPQTEVVSLSSQSFYYSSWVQLKDQPLPLKVGSLQTFLNGYINAQSWFSMHPTPLNTALPLHHDISVPINHGSSLSLDSKFQWSLSTIQQFREEVEKLVVLDYLMRNTDRGLDNWMVKVEWREIRRFQNVKTMRPTIKIGAIDSGLSFPYKHPDGWRSFPYGWLYLPLCMIGQPFSTRMRKHYLCLLTSTWWWEQTVTKMKAAFQKDGDFKERMWSKQLAILKGQAFNLVEVLRPEHMGPLQLVKKEQILVKDELVSIPVPLVNSDVSSINERYLAVQLNPNSGSSLEDTPLLCDSSSPISSIERNQHNDNSRKNDTTDGNEEPGIDVSATVMRKVAIEKLEISTSKPPIFTWC